MSVRFRRSVKIAPGVRLNVSKKSVGVSVGTRGARASINSNGRVTRSIGIPGTGISNVEITNISNNTVKQESASGYSPKSANKEKKRKKPTLWLVLSLLFFFATLSGLFDKNYIGSIGCLIIAIIMLSVYVKKKKTFTCADNVSNNEEKKNSDEKAQDANADVTSTAKESHATFPLMDEEQKAYLRYSYYDVQVKGVEHRDFDYGKIGLNNLVKFEAEPDNQYDPNAIKVLCNDEFIGYIPKNRLQEMLISYRDDDGAEVIGFVKKIDQSNNEIVLALGFYRTLEDAKSGRIEVVDSTLVKTNKKNEWGEQRLDKLAFVDVGESVVLDYDYDSESYVVKNSFGNEIGEINQRNSEKIFELEEDGQTIHGAVLEKEENEDGKLICRIRVIAW